MVDLKDSGMIFVKNFIKKIGKNLNEKKTNKKFKLKKKIYSNKFDIAKCVSNIDEKKKLSL